MKTVGQHLTLDLITKQRLDRQTHTLIHNFMFRSSSLLRERKREKLIMILLLRQELNVLFHLDDRYISLLD